MRKEQRTRGSLKRPAADQARRQPLIEAIRKRAAEAGLEWIADVPETNAIRARGAREPQIRKIDERRAAQLNVGAELAIVVVVLLIGRD